MEIGSEVAEDIGFVVLKFGVEEKVVQGGPRIVLPSCSCLQDWKLSSL